MKYGNKFHIQNAADEGSNGMQELKDAVFAYIKSKYKCLPQYLWTRFPEYAVFRHRDNGKWFALYMSVPRGKLGLAGEGEMPILNVRMPSPLLADVLLSQPGFLRGYHFARGNWISILLDGTAAQEDVLQWLDESYLGTASTAEKQRLRPPKEWIIPANPKYFDIVHAFDHTQEIRWKQGKGIKKGDTVYMYVAAPVSAILYKCRVLRTDIPTPPRDGKVRIYSHMMIRLLKRYAPERFTFEILGRDYGIYAVRGPRGIPEELSKALK